MKKVALLTPLIALSLFSCGNKIKKPIDLLIRVDTLLNLTKFQTFYTYDKSYRVVKIEDIEYVRQTDTIHNDIIDTFTYKGSKINYIEHSWICDGEEASASKTTYTYDTKGNLIETEEIGTNSDGDDYKDKYNFEYNEQKLITSYKRYNTITDDYHLVEHHAYEYNDHKDMIKDIHFIPGREEVYCVTTFTYDEYYCCIREDTNYVSGSHDPEYKITTYYKNNPDKPKHKYNSERGTNTDYEYDELDRLKSSHSKDSFNDTTDKTYYYDD